MKTEAEDRRKVEGWRGQDRGCMAAILCIVVVLAMILFAIDALLSAVPD